MAKVDLKGAYYFVPILPEHQKYLKPYFRRKIYLFTCLPNDLCSGLHKFTKLQKPPLFYLRLQQVPVAGFIDDLIKLERSFGKCERNIKLIVTLLHSLGFVVCPNKSIFVLARSIEYLGFVIDSQSMTISLTKKKKVYIKQLCHEVLEEEFLIIRTIAGLLGKFTVFLQCVLAHCITSHWSRVKLSHSNLPKEILTKRWKFPLAAKMDISW